VCQSATDTITSKIAKNRPRPLFLTDGGDYKVRRKAKKLTQMVEGIFYENKAYDLGPLIFRDGCVLGDGLVHVYAKNKRVHFDRVLASELFVDEIEGFYGNPRQMHRVKPIDRAVLLAAFPKKRAEIEAAKAAEENNAGKPNNVSDMVTVRESWHLPSGPDAKDGKHFISVDGAALTPVDEWEHDFFPFARFQWSPKLYGYWSQGLVEQIQNIQIEINKLLMLVQKSYHLGGSFKILVENGSKIVKEHLNNDVGTIVNYTGTRPEYVVPPLIPPEIYAHLTTLIQRAYEQSGSSMLSATSQKPAGLNSGKALREYNDIESDRFATISHSYEQFFMDLARLSVATVKEIAEEEGSYEVKVPSRNLLRQVDWKDIDLADDEYVMQCFPVSSLPHDPAGRLQTVQEYAQAGYLSPRQARRLLDFPDLEQVESLQNAAEEYLTQVLEMIVDDGVMTAPEPFDDLALARELALEFYAQGKCQNLDEDKLELLRRFLGQLDVLENQAMPPPAAQTAALPQAQPAAPPQSDLIPNVPGMSAAA
jgi:hypothetical protein